MGGQTIHTGAFFVLREAIFVKEGAEYIKIRLADISFLHADGNYTKIYIENIKHHVAVRIGILVENLPPDIFLRVHRCYAINIKHVWAYKRRHVFIGDHQLPISKSNKAHFLEAIKR